MKRKILIIAGGISKERVISLDTGRQVAKELKKNNYQVKITEPNYQLFETIKSFKPKIIDELLTFLVGLIKINYVPLHALFGAFILFYK